MILNPMEHPICLVKPLRMGPPSAWLGHTPFAMYLISLLHPGTVVELGVHTGVSYCAFCQVVKQLGLATRCYGIDHWKGDPQSGFYDSSLLSELKAYHDPFYGSFSKLVQSDFEAALPLFADHSIDLLHIDGFHSYAAVHRDFEGWKPKMTPGGVVLLHDIAVRQDGYEVWRFWEELKAQYPHFEMPHCNGLGLISLSAERKDAIGKLIGAGPEEQEVLKNLFQVMGDRLTNEIGLVELQAQLNKQTAANRALEEKARQTGAAHEKMQKRYDSLLYSLAHIGGLAWWKTRQFFAVSRAGGPTQPSAGGRTQAQTTLAGKSIYMEESLDLPLKEVLPVIQNRIMQRTQYFGINTFKNPLDAWVYQEIIFEVKPDVIIEIGNASGGSTLMLAHYCDELKKGRIIGLDLAQAGISEMVKSHPRISLIEGDACQNIDKVKELISRDEKVLVIEDSSHTFENTLAVLRTYSSLVSTGSYLIVEDSICRHGLEVGPNPGPYEAVESFMRDNSQFEIDRSRESFLITWNPKGYLRKK